MITPILKDPRKHGGTLYTFPSASRDLTRSFSSSEYEFAFSHFACLNLPDFRYGSYFCEDSDSESDIYRGNDPKGIYLNDLCPISIDKTNNINESLKWHIQSYVMNYEVAILNGFSLDSGKYDNEILRTPSERLFFNWLQKVKAIKFSGNRESLDGYGYDTENLEHGELDYEYQLSDADPSKSYRIDNKLYTWKGGEWRSRVLVSNTVQYIGTIDMVNNVNIDYDSFNEIYLNIPSNVGRSTDVYFDRNVFDANYSNGEEIDIKKDEYCIDTDIIIGRQKDDSNVTLKAIYDSEYIIDDKLETGYYSYPKYKIDNGYCINFNDSKYSGGIEGMNLKSEEDFEFNCVLIYYRIRKNNGEWYTNLYGVLFLEEVSTSDFNTSLNEDDELAGYIQRYPKFKNGNSWGLKLDLKIDAQPDSQMELRDIEYVDPNEGGSGMQMFTEALVHLNDCTKIFYEVKKENTDIEERLYTLENMVSGIDSVYDLRNDVSNLRTKIEEFQPTINSLEGTVESIESRITKLEKDFGYLISDVKSSIVDIKNRVSSLENNLKNK